MTNPIAPAAGTTLAAAQLPDGSTAFKQLLTDTAGADAMGTADALPGGNTLLGRLKAIWTSLTDPTTGLPGVIAGIAATASATRILAVTPNDSVALNPVPRALIVTVAGNLALKGADAAAVTIPVVAGQTIPLKATYVMATGTTASVVALA